jgi:hypothetical protein
MEAVVAYPDMFLEEHRETMKYLSIMSDLAEILIKHLLITDLQH